jgi:hypothetical protein
MGNFNVRINAFTPDRPAHSGNWRTSRSAARMQDRIGLPDGAAETAIPGVGFQLAGEFGKIGVS